jgi:hypothetical protein
VSSGFLDAFGDAEVEGGECQHHEEEDDRERAGVTEGKARISLQQSVGRRDLGGVGRAAAGHYKNEVGIVEGTSNNDDFVVGSPAAVA